MRSFIPLILALCVLAGCGQSEPAATANQPAAATAAVDSRPASSTEGATAPAAAAATTAVAQASATTAPATGSTAATTPATAAAAQPSTQTAPGIMTNPIAAAGFVEGRHYVRLSAVQPTNPNPGQVEVNEFFMYSCVHCYNLEPYVQAWLPNKPAHINFVPVPTAWDAVRRLHAQAFYAASALGKVEEMHLPLFQEMHVNGDYLETPAKMRQFFSRYGVSGDDFDSVIDSFSVVQAVNRADDLGTRYRVESTPTIIVAGKYRTGVSEAGGTPERLFALIEALAAAELTR